MYLFDSKILSAHGVSVVRMITGIFLIYHGTQMFRTDEMVGYGQWLGDLKIPFPLGMAYVGKSIEFIGGICLLLGVLTRIASALLFFTFIFISVVMGEGKIFTDSQHPFLFALLVFIFFFHGPGRISLDHFLSQKQKQKI